MEFFEILLIIACALFVISVITTSLIRREKGKTSCGCDCSSCSSCSNCKREN